MALDTATPVQPTFVGRRREIAAISSALDETQDGRGSLLLLVGDAGAGKTRTAEEGAATAVRRGFRV